MHLHKYELVLFSYVVKEQKWLSVRSYFVSIVQNIVPTTYLNYFSDMPTRIISNVCGDFKVYGKEELNSMIEDYE